MKRTHLLSILAVVTLLAGSITAATPRAQAASNAYNLIMNWFPEPEEGGYYTAQRLGMYQKDGVNSSVNEFSFAVTSTIPYVLEGKAAFGMANADEVLRFVAKGAKIVVIMNTFQTNPQGLLWHAEDTSIHSLADLSNHTLIYSFGGGFEPYLVLKYHYKNLKTKSYDFTSRGFALDPKAVNQCYVTSEPYLWGKQGLKIRYALIADSGYSPYGDVIYTTQDMIKNHPDAVRAYVKASVAGWKLYLANSTVAAATNSYMLTAPGAKNYVMKTDEQNYSYSQLKRLRLVAGGDAVTHGIGYSNPARWKTLQQQMVSVGEKVGGVDTSKMFTNQFLATK